MDIQCVLYWFIIIFSIDQVQFTDGNSKLPASDWDVTTSIDGIKQCQTKLYSCSLKGKVGEMGLNGLVGEPGPKGEKGPKGEMGNVGLPGSKGELGTKGDTGSPGIPGQKGIQGDQGPIGNKGEVGMKGEMGSKGEAGSVGFQGDTGARGIPGDKGIKGERGFNGDKGEPGLKGDKGPVGPQGVPGLIGVSGLKGDAGPPGIAGQPGSCQCLNSDGIKTKTQDPPSTHISPGDSEIDDDDDDTVDPPESAEEKVVSSCKQVETKSGKYWIRPSNPFEVYCDMEKNVTCILIDEPSDFTIERYSVGYKYEIPFWLSEKNFTLTNFYKGITIEQIEWLQKQSTFITQRIRYHCKNSYINPKGNSSIETALRLLSWKETVLGPKPTDNTPFFYSVPPESDGCKNSGEFKTEWKYSDIQLISTTQGLPVIDFHIRDIRHEDQWIYLELRELCFG